MVSLVTKKTDFFPTSLFSRWESCMGEMHVEEWVLLSSKLVVAMDGGAY